MRIKYRSNLYFPYNNCLDLSQRQLLIIKICLEVSYLEMHYGHIFIFNTLSSIFNT